MITIAVLLAAYFALLAVLSFAVTPYRRRIARLGAELCELNLTPVERRVVEGLMRSTYSWRGAIVLLFAYLEGLFLPVAALDRESEQLQREAPTFVSDPRMHQMSDAYFASAVAVNPLVGLLAVAARWAFHLKARLHHSGAFADRITDYRAASVPVG
jgi:hypothetical protein